MKTIKCNKCTHISKTLKESIHHMFTHKRQKAN